MNSTEPFDTGSLERQMISMFNAIYLASKKIPQSSYISVKLDGKWVTFEDNKP
jgi:hypothetical protein